LLNGSSFSLPGDVSGLVGVTSGEILVLEFVSVSPPHEVNKTVSNSAVINVFKVSMSFLGLVLQLTFIFPLVYTIFSQQAILQIILLKLLN
jgi:hypothetical protein